jgi:hypothetical protein
MHEEIHRAKALSAFRYIAREMQQAPRRAALVEREAHREQRFRPLVAREHREAAAVDRLQGGGDKVPTRFERGETGFGFLAVVEG